MEGNMAKQNISRLVTIVFAISIFFTLFQSCRDNSVSIVNTRDNLNAIIPLKIGASWTYKCFYTGWDRFDSSRLKRTVVNLFDTLGLRWYVIAESSFALSTDSLLGIHKVYETIDKGSYIRFRDWWYYTVEILLKTPITDGNAWIHFPDYTSENETYILNCDTTVTVSSKQYPHTIIIKSDGGWTTIMISRGYGRIYEDHTIDLGWAYFYLISTNIKA
jgi:hypothetical protein